MTTSGSSCSTTPRLSSVTVSRTTGSASASTSSGNGLPNYRPTARRCEDRFKRACYRRSRPRSPISPSEAQRAAAAPANWNSTISSSSPAPCCAMGNTVPMCAQPLRQRYQRLLLDEFQDTDPIQVELAVLIASSDPAGRAEELVDGRGRTRPVVLRRRPEAVDLPFPARRHRHVPHSPRRASSARAKQLTKNFRTGRPIVEWVNATFGALIVEADRSQPAYLPLLPVPRRTRKRCRPWPLSARSMTRSCTRGPTARGRGRRRRSRDPSGHPRTMVGRRPRLRRQ